MHLMEEKYEARGWHSHHLSGFCVWLLETEELKFVLLSIQFMLPVHLQCCKASYIYFHHGHWRAMKCAMFRLFHKLKGKVVTSLFFFTMILSLSPVGKYCMEEEVICCWQHWTQREVLEDGEPKSPKTKCHCNHQWWSWTLSFCFSSWSQE